MAITLTSAELATLSDGTISNNAAKQVMDELWSDGQSKALGGAVTHDATGHLVGQGAAVSASARVDSVIEAKGLKQMNDAGALEKIVDEVMAANAENVAQFRAGKEKAFNALVGQVMKASKGKANPQQVNDVLRQKLG